MVIYFYLNGFSTRQLVIIILSGKYLNVYTVLISYDNLIPIWNYNFGWYYNVYILLFI